MKVTFTKMSDAVRYLQNKNYILHGANNIEINRDINTGFENIRIYVKESDLRDIDLGALKADGGIYSFNIKQTSENDWIIVCNDGFILQA